MRRVILILGVFGATVAACSSPVAGPSSPPPAAAVPASAPPAAKAIDAVSLSAPSPDAAAALKACGTDRVGIDRVAQIGEIPSARLAPDYVELWGVEPEIQTDAPAWIIVYSGRISLGRGIWAEDPFCLVINGRATFFAPHEQGRGDRSLTPPTLPTKPTLVLPTPAP